MKKIIICRGLPASGKSSWAKEFVLKNLNWKRINLDDLRAMLDNSHMSKDNEKFVKAMRDMLILEALKAGKSVVSDNTHLSPKSVNHIKQLVDKFNKDHNDNVQVEEKFFDTPVEECIKRDLKRPNSVGQKVIMDMYTQFLAPDVTPTLIQDPTLPRAVLVDIDGTVAKMTTRGPFEWKRVGEDAPKNNIINIVKSVAKNGYKVIFFSGRDAICKPETMDWIKIHFGWDVSQYSIYMRNIGDSRKDSIVKKEMFDRHIRNIYYIEAVFDDRNQVVDTWRKEIGLTCLQVDYGDF